MAIPKDHTNDTSSDLLNKSCTHTDSMTNFSRDNTCYMFLKNLSPTDTDFKRLITEDNLTVKDE